MYAQHFEHYTHYFHPISLIITIHLVLLINIPVYDAQVDYGKYYSECSKNATVRCGETMVGPIYYPFWGENIRPSYCGLEGFELSCENNEIPVIDIGSGNKYRVAEIHPSASEIILNRYAHKLEDTCAPKFSSSTLNRTLFEYGPDTEDLYMFYGCPLDLYAPVKWGIPNNFTCGTGEKGTQVIFGVESHLIDDLHRLKELCTPSNRVPVNWTDLENLPTNVNRLLQQLSERSFVVHYKINETACQGCWGADDRVCWNGAEVGVNSSCLYKPAKPGKPQDGRLKIGIGGVAVISMLLFLLFIIICYRRIKTRHESSSYPKDVEAFIRNYASSKPCRFRYAALKKITSSFKYELGKGGYGNVYKGSLTDGRVVAVKILSETKGNGEEFMNEVASIGRTSHVNVVTLLGYVYEGKKRALIYEYMPNGSLEKFIHGTTPSLKCQILSWEKLYNIAIGIARGLEYLHCGCNTQILHFDIKPHNILLDKDFCPKISDFGLAKLYNREKSILSSIMHARGTIGYIAPEVISRNFGPVSHKSDVYSYGMMILEMVGGRKNVDARAARTSEIYFPRWVYKHIHDNEETSSADNITEEENHVVRKMMIVGLWCIQTNPAHRPSISKVMEMFEGDSAALEMPPKPYMCSPPSSP
ncbi:hypothetical protein ACET3Z_011532 [Daucus carota]